MQRSSLPGRALAISIGAFCPLLLLCLGACGPSGSSGRKQAPKARSTSETPAKGPRADATVSPTEDASRPEPQLPPAQPPTAEGDFGEQLRTTYDQIFCRGKAPDGACRSLDKVLERFRKRQLEPVRGFLADKRPEALPKTVLYPFSGGDILSALIAFPDKTRFVLLSLEQAGAPEPLRALKPRAELRGRERFLRHAERLMRNTFSHTADLLEPEGVRIPGLLPIILLGLHAHGAEVTGLRYFKISPRGEIEYFSRKDLEQAGAWPRKPYKGGRRIYADPEYNQPYSHAEIRFRLPGDKEDRALQHIAADISMQGLERLKGVRELLEKLEPHSLLIKAASFLLWKERYAPIRELILAKARFLVADTSAPQPDVLLSKGFTLRTHGYFRCAVIASVRSKDKKWVREFTRQRSTPIPFAFGYRDCKRNGNVILGYRQEAPPPGTSTPATSPATTPPQPKSTTTTTTPRAARDGGAKRPSSGAEGPGPKRQIPRPPAGGIR
ncbi:MAG: hypothetical protein RBU30_22435 [Polyangia bacterium]|jgi:hypothetical protein|nr:hypothetical protein [Polyangia bacterium]